MATFKITLDLTFLLLWVINKKYKAILLKAIDTFTHLIAVFHPALGTLWHGHIQLYLFPRNYIPEMHTHFLEVVLLMSWFLYSNKLGNKITFQHKFIDDSAHSQLLNAIKYAMLSRQF